MLRAHAVWAARRLGRGDLLSGMQAEHDPSVIEELIRPDVPTSDRFGAPEVSQA
jgi:hypothetical protein